MKSKTLIYEIERPSEMGAGIRGYNETVLVTVDSGELGGEPGEFAEYIRDALKEWHDGAGVSPAKVIEDTIVLTQDTNQSQLQLAFEYGFRECEKGSNLQMALANYHQAKK